MLIGWDIGGTKCAVVAGEDPAHIVSKVSFPTADKQSTLDRLIAETAKFDRIDSVGISCGGPLDSKRGVILCPPNLPGWENEAITDRVRAAFGVPAALVNDANACALAEWQYGAGVGTRSMIFLTFGTGLGAGLILDGKLYEGASGMAGEAGHIRLSKDGPLGYGKYGSFEGYCSGGGIARQARAFAERCFAEGRACGFCSDPAGLAGISAASVAAAAHAGDADAIGIFRACGEKLGEGLSVLMDILNPDAIVIGSVFARSGDLLIPAMTAVIEREALPETRAVCRVLPAALGERIGDVAALTVARTALSSNK